MSEEPITVYVGELVTDGGFKIRSGFVLYADHENHLGFLTAENKRLRSMLEDQQAAVCHHQDRVIKRDNRIKELERDRKVGLEERGYHIITTDKIDKAWGRLKANTEETWTDYTHGVFDTLDDLNIVACEECGGSGKKESRSSSMREEPMLWTCPTCHGHGWVVK